jgi:cytochrome c peroxidase
LSRRPGRFWLAIATLGCIAAAPATDWRWALAPGIAPPPVPAGNAMTTAKVELGRRLFYDADLSIDGTMACSSCHEQRRGFADGNRTRPGVHGDPGRRNVPGLVNVGWMGPLTWADPGLQTLEAQVLVPVFGDHPVEMGMKGSEAEVARRFGRDPCYVRMFAAAFPETGGRIDMAGVAMAIATFERSMVSHATPYDLYRRGRKSYFPPIARAGAMLFAARCASCHQGANFTDGGFHAVDTRPDPQDAGLFEKTGRPADRGLFRTPPLRNVALTAPYLHDGSAPTIADAIRRHAIPQPDEAGMTALIAFLVRLTDAGFVNDPALAMPDNACGKPL